MQQRLCFVFLGFEVDRFVLSVADDDSGNAISSLADKNLLEPHEQGSDPIIDACFMQVSSHGHCAAMNSLQTRSMQSCSDVTNMMSARRYKRKSADRGALWTTPAPGRPRSASLRNAPWIPAIGCGRANWYISSEPAIRPLPTPPALGAFRAADGWRSVVHFGESDTSVWTGTDICGGAGMVG